MLKELDKNQFLIGKFIGIISLLLGLFLLPKIVYSTALTNESIIKLSNKERSEYNLPLLRANQSLSEAALEKAQDIFLNQNFSHNIGNKKFSAWIKNAGYEYSYTGENLAMDFISSEGVIGAWLNSPMHKKNLLNAYFQEIGVAIVDGNLNGEQTTLVVQIFGSPLFN